MTGATSHRGVRDVMRLRLLCVVMPLVSSGSLSAQAVSPTKSLDAASIRCSVTASAPVVRIEGTRELVGDVLLTCYSTRPEAGARRSEFLSADLTLSLNVNIGNRTDFGRGADVTDAVLVVNENNCSLPAGEGMHDACEPENSTVQGPMLGRRDESQPRSLRWSGIEFPVPGAAIGNASPSADCTGSFDTAGGCHPRTTTLRLTNVRARAAQLGASGEVSNTAVPLEASVTLRAAGAIIGLERSSLRVAEAATGMTAEAASLDPDRICSHRETVAEVTITEGFAAAFKTTGQPDLRPGDPGWNESFYPIHEETSGQGSGWGGTRVRVALSGIPQRASVRVPSSVACASGEETGSLELGLVDGASSSGLGGMVSPGQVGDRTLSIGSDFEAAAVYEVTNSNALVREDCRIPFRFSRTGPPGSLFRGGNVEVSVSLAPFQTASTEAGTGDELRFVDVEFSPRPSFGMTGCGTTIFFPFVTNRSNFDTAIVVSNTSADPHGTRHQSGQCTLRYHGSGGEGQPDPATQRSVEIEAGSQLAFTLSNGNPAKGLAPLTDFEGYLVVECAFQHGHGYAFVTEQVNGTAVLAQGYLAQIVRVADDVGAAASPP